MNNQIEQPQKHPRGTSPNQEIREGFEEWVGRLRTIGQSPVVAATVPPATDQPEATTPVTIKHG